MLLLHEIRNKVRILIVTVKFQTVTQEVEDKLNVREIEPLEGIYVFVSHNSA